MSDKEVLNILGKKVELGQSAKVSFNVAKLHTQNRIDVPVIIERSKKPGPTVLVTAGIHGDEINGVMPYNKLSGTDFKSRREQKDFSLH